jgi:putative membrane protein
MIRGYSDHAANEQTFLAWLRTSIAVIAFGFVVEKLNLFALTAVSAPSHEASRSQLEKLSGPLGRGAGHAFIVVGILFIVVATFRFVRTGRLLDDSSIHSPCIMPDLIFAVIISSLLIALSTYLLLVRTIAAGSFSRGLVG